MDARKIEVDEAALDEIIKTLKNMVTLSPMEQLKSMTRPCLPVTNFFRENRNKVVRAGICLASTSMLAIVLYFCLSSAMQMIDDDSSQKNHTKDDSITKEKGFFYSSIVAMALFIGVCVLSARIKKCGPDDLSALPETDDQFLLKDISTLTETQMNALIALRKCVTEIVDRNSDIKANNSSIVQNPITMPFFGIDTISAKSISVKECLTLLETFKAKNSSYKNFKMIDKAKINRLLAEAVPKNEVNETTSLMNVVG
jgi:hypothetical protein